MKEITLKKTPPDFHVVWLRDDQRYYYHVTVHSIRYDNHDHWCRISRIVLIQLFVLLLIIFDTTCYLSFGKNEHTVTCMRELTHNYILQGTFILL